MPGFARQFDSIETHEDLWDAAQNQPRIERRIHKYLCVLWGEKILHWSQRPRDALQFMIELSNKL